MQQILLFGIGVFVLGLLIGNFCVVVDFSESIGIDLLEHARPGHRKQALKNNWTNTALLAALLFTIIASYGLPFDAENKLSDFPVPKKYVPERMRETSEALFVSFVAVGFMEYLIAMSSATIHLMYTDALSLEDAGLLFYTAL